MTELSEQPLLAGLTAEELAALASLGTIRTYRAGEKIIAATEPATSLFFLKSGVVHVKLPDGIRLATITAGMAFGEMALLETHPFPAVDPATSITPLQLPLAPFDRFHH